MKTKKMYPGFVSQGKEGRKWACIWPVSPGYTLDTARDTCIWIRDTPLDTVAGYNLDTGRIQIGDTDKHGTFTTK